MSTPLPPDADAGNTAAAQIDYPGPPKEDGAEQGAFALDNRLMGWRWQGAEWVAEPQYRTIYVVVDAPGVFAMPRAWAFESEQEAVAFRLKRLSDGNRRAGSCQPVLAIPLGNPLHDGFNEINWGKYPAPKPEGAKKWG